MSQVGHNNIEEPHSLTAFFRYISFKIYLTFLDGFFYIQIQFDSCFFLTCWNILVSQKCISAQRPDVSSNNNYVAQSSKPIVQPSKSSCLIKEARLLFLHCTFITLCLTSYTFMPIYIRTEIYMFQCLEHCDLQHRQSRAPMLARDC